MSDCFLCNARPLPDEARVDHDERVCFFAVGLAIGLKSAQAMTTLTLCSAHARTVAVVLRGLGVSAPVHQVWPAAAKAAVP